MDPKTLPPTRTLPPTWAARFFTIWTGQAFSLVGSALVQFALVWWLTSKTNSGTVLATATVVALLPQIVLGPFAGALVDRWNRRIIMIVADAGIAAATAVLMLLFAAGLAQVWHVYVILLLRSLGGAFHQPAMSASTTLMVPDRHLARVAGANQLLQGLIGIFAPLLGALLIGLMSTQGILLIDILTASVAVASLFVVAIPQPARPAAHADGGAGQASYWQDLRAGFLYVWKWPGLFALILLAMMLNFLLSPSGSLLPLLVTREFKGGYHELAWVESAFGAGIILGGILLGAWGGFKRRIMTSFMGIVGIGIGVLASGLVPEELFGWLLAACFLIGFAQVFANGPLQAIFQSAVAPEMQGRVFSLIGAGAAAMMPLSLMIAGPAADRWGVRTWYLAGGAICLLVILAALAVPAIMNIEQNRHQPPSGTGS